LVQNNHSIFIRKLIFFNKHLAFKSSVRYYQAFISGSILVHDQELFVATSSRQLFGRQA